MSEELEPQPSDHRLESTPGVVQSIRACDQAILDFQRQVAESLCMRSGKELRVKSDETIDAIFNSGSGPVALQRLRPTNAFLNLAMVDSDGSKLTFAISTGRSHLFIKFYRGGSELADVQFKLEEFNPDAFDHIAKIRGYMVDSISDKGIAVRYEDAGTQEEFTRDLKRFTDSLSKKRPGLFPRLLGRRGAEEETPGLPIPAHYYKTRIIPPTEVAEIFDTMTTIFKHTTARIVNQPRIEGK